MDGWSWMTAAFRAVLPVAHARFHEVADQAGARGNPDVFGLIREPTGSASEQATNRLYFEDGEVKVIGDEPDNA